MSTTRKDEIKAKFSELLTARLKKRGIECVFFQEETRSRLQDLGEHLRSPRFDFAPWKLVVQAETREPLCGKDYEKEALATRLYELWDVFCKGIQNRMTAGLILEATPEMDELRMTQAAETFAESLSKFYPGKKFLNFGLSVDTWTPVGCKGLGVHFRLQHCDFVLTF